MKQIIATDKLRCILIFYGGAKKLYIQPNFAGVDEPRVQKVDDGSDLAKAKLEEWKADGLITFVEDGKVEKAVDEYTKRDLIQHANENFEADWDEDEYMKKTRDVLLELVEELENPSNDD